jgi:hypothetical protein
LVALDITGKDASAGSQLLTLGVAMKLRFYARAGQMVRVPGQQIMVGQPVKYVGRKTVKDMRHEASSDPYEVEAGTRRAMRLVKLVRRDQCLWPADEPTAKACGVRFVPVKQDSNGEWVAVTPPVKKAAKKEG